VCKQIVLRRKKKCKKEFKKRKINKQKENPCIKKQVKKKYNSSRGRQ